MISENKKVSLSGMILAILIIINVLAIRAGYTSSQNWYWILIATIPLLILAILNMRQSIHSSRFSGRIDEQTTKGFEEKYFRKAKGESGNKNFSHN